MRRGYYEFEINNAPCGYGNPHREFDIKKANRVVKTKQPSNSSVALPKNSNQDMQYFILWLLSLIAVILIVVINIPVLQVARILCRRLQNPTHRD